MFSMLPDLTPRDSHSLWYTSSRNTVLPLLDYTSPATAPATSNASANYLASAGAALNGGPSGLGPENGGPARVPIHALISGTLGAGAPVGGGAGATPTAAGATNARSAVAHIMDRSPIGRLRADEIYMERRRNNVANMGSAWLKPPGISKTLFQMREEQREAQEQAEVNRRERLAQELAEAAEADAGVAEGVTGEMGLGTGEEEGDLMMDDGGEQDLDDDIPDADDGGFGFDGVSDDDEDEEEEEEDGEESVSNEGMIHGHLSSSSEDDDEHEVSHLEQRAQRREMQSRIASMRAAEDRMRQVMVRGGHAGAAGRSNDLYGAEEDELDEENQAQMLEEEDLASSYHVVGGENRGGPAGLEMDMDADLDDEIPEAELSGGYEHTDSEAELSSDDAEAEVSYVQARRASGQHQQARRSLGRTAQGPRSSMDISGFLSRDGSSVLGSSPQFRRGI